MQYTVYVYFWHTGGPLTKTCNVCDRVFVRNCFQSVCVCVFCVCERERELERVYSVCMYVIASFHKDISRPNLNVKRV